LKGTDDIGRCLDQIYIAVFIRNYVTATIHDQFKVLCGIEKMIEDDVMNQFEVIF
jgi:hypothetical protein